MSTSAGMDAGARRNLADRLETQGWDQGCLLPFTRRLLLAKGDEPVSILAADGLEKAGKLGQAGAQMLLVRPAQQVGAILVTQICDLLADPADEPCAEAMPIVKLLSKQKLPQTNSTRAFLLDADKRWVVDATHRLQVEKSLIPDQDAQQLLTTPERQRIFAAWLARRSTRAAFPNDFEATVSRTLKRVLTTKRFAEDPVAPHLQLLRVGLDPSDRAHVYLVLPFDEIEAKEADAQAYANALFDGATRRLPDEIEKAKAFVAQRATGEQVRDYRLMQIQPVPLDLLTMRMMLAMAPLNLEHFTYGHAAVTGAEPHVELEG